MGWLTGQHFFSMTLYQKIKFLLFLPFWYTVCKNYCIKDIFMRTCCFQITFFTRKWNSFNRCLVIFNCSFLFILGWWLCPFWLYYCFFNSKGPHVKYEGGKGGGRRVFVGVMKYYRHILMDHETFFKIFEGPQNIFLCSIFVI